MRKFIISTMALGFALSSHAQESVDIGSEAFGDAVREYLLENPEVIFEAVDVYNKEQAEIADAQIKENIVKSHDALYDETATVVLGNPEGSFAIVEFSDYECGYCKKSHDEMGEIFGANEDLKILVHQLPIRSQDSLNASKVVLAVKKVYGNEDAMALHNSLFDSTDKPSQEVALSFAEGQGLERAKIEAELDSDFVYNALAQSQQLAEALQVSGTPGFVVGDELVGGYVPYETMNQIIAAKKGS